MHWKRLLASIGAIFLGLVLLVATWGKMLEPAAFVEQIQMEKLDFLFSARTVMLWALALEAGLGTVLVLGIRRIWVLIPTTCLVAFFLFLTGRNYWLVVNGLRDPNTACGCFGSLLERTAEEAFWQDLALLGPPLALAWWKTQLWHRTLPWFRLVIALMVVTGVVVVAGSNTDLRFAEIASEIGENANEKTSIEGFDRTYEYTLSIEGNEAAEAAIYHSAESVSFLIMDSQIPHVVLLRVKSKTVETIPFDQVIPEINEESITITSDGVASPHGPFQVSIEGLTFTVKGVKMSLRNSSAERSK